MKEHGGLTWRDWQVIAAAIHGPFPPAVLYRLVNRNMKLFLTMIFQKEKRYRKNINSI